MNGLHFKLGPDQQAVVDAARGVIRKLEPKRNEHLRMIFEEQRFPEEVWEEMGTSGIWGSLVPEAYGGTGLGLTGMTLAMEEFATAGLVNAFGILTTMATMAILRGGNEAQRQHWLPRIADGSLKIAFAITEPDCGTNSFRMRTHAKFEGGRYLLNGEKGWITGADVSDWILVVARTKTLDEVREMGLPRAFGMSLFLIPRETPGLTMTQMPTAGIEGFRQMQLYFEDVEVPPEHRIGDDGLGAAALFDALNPERILAAAIAIGMSEFALSRAVAWARQRVVFKDTPIGAYQGVQHPLARVKVDQEAARLLTWRAAWLFDQGAPPDEVGAAANMAKLTASELGVFAVDRAIQTLGGNGFVRDNHLINMWAPARLLKTAPINNEMILNHIAEHVLGLPRSY